MSTGKYAALATDADGDADADRQEDLAEEMMGSPMPVSSPRVTPHAARSGGNNESDGNGAARGILRSPTMDGDTSAPSFDDAEMFANGTPPPPRAAAAGIAAAGAGKERRVSFSDIRVVHNVDDDDDDAEDDADDLSASFARLFDVDNERRKGSPKPAAEGKSGGGSTANGGNGSKLARVSKECEALKSENLLLTHQLRSMGMLVKSLREKLESQAKLASELKRESSTLQESLWASVTGSQPRQSLFEGELPLATATATATHRRRANTDFGPPAKPKPVQRRRAHTEVRGDGDVDVGLLALPPGSPKRMLEPKKKKLPSRLSFSAFFGGGGGNAASGEEEEEEEEGEENEDSSLGVVDAPATVENDTSRARSSSYPSDGRHHRSTKDCCLNSYPALQRQVGVLQAQLMTAHKKQHEHASLEKKFLDLKLELATKCAELEELQMQFSANATEQHSVVSDLNDALVEKDNLQSQIDQLRDRLEEVTKDYQLLQTNHHHLQRHIDATARKSSVSLSTPRGAPPTTTGVSSWRTSFARRFSSLTSTVDDSEEVAAAQSIRERSKSHATHGGTHHRHGGHRHRKGSGSSKKRSKHARSKSEIPTSIGGGKGAGGRSGTSFIHHAQRRSMPPQPLHLVAAAKSPPATKDDPLDILTEDPLAEQDGDDGDEDVDIDDYMDGKAGKDFSQLRGWFGGSAKMGGGVSAAGVGTGLEDEDEDDPDGSHQNTAPLLTAIHGAEL